jgi:hypothetical protein
MRHKEKIKELLNATDLENHPLAYWPSREVHDEFNRFVTEDVILHRGLVESDEHR